MPSLLPVIATAVFVWPWANPTWVKLTPAPIDLTLQKIVLSPGKPLKVDDDYAQVQVALGKNTPEISHAIIYGTFDKSAVRAVHVEVCRDDDQCVELQFKGMSLSKESYAAKYYIPDSVKRGDKFSKLRIWSETPMPGVIVHWVSGDTASL